MKNLIYILTREWNILFFFLKDVSLLDPKTYIIMIAIIDAIVEINNGF